MEHYPCHPQRDCRFRAAGECKEIVHHRYWPRKTVQAMGRIARQFREEDFNKERTCLQRERDIHALSDGHLPTPQELEEYRRGRDQDRI